MKLLTTLLLIILCSISAISQEYTPFDFEHGEWYTYYSVKGGMFGGGHELYYANDSVKFFCSGDTIINDTSYRKLYFEGNTSSQIVPLTYISGYYGAIRNDTAHKQVWFNVNNYSYLIYDFNIIDGDSICNQVQYGLPATFYFCGIIQSIDSVFYCNKYYRRYNIENNQSIIEGIGSSKGLFPVKSLPWYSKFLCYNENNNIDCEPCNFNFSNFVDNALSENVIIVNQIDNQLQITSEHVMESVELIDIYGRSISRVNSLNCNTTNLIVSQKGFYILKVRIDDKILCKKIVLK